ncbi:MgtC/SapB family protein [Clostridium gasigenes]|uniref:MgtC/SapB family protein n=1 Tax=Clostridium gasigenes TaxID=94869 RepID=A0A7X0VUE1_9CLOT|nr:MgtC/SapB family protein [Clostridium gasigenes]MBB6716416.1 MgtC/SapB family protein [Clostridium gasigenes]MBU3089591.1 MgtC/SapB family protein [Clostridium gasigenes]
MVDIFIRISLAIVIGGIIGYERQYTNSPAGFRTHILVALGACIISLIQVKMVNDTLVMISSNEALANVYKIDMGRLGAQVVSGIGFLGAGTIIHTKGSIKGLTTAASIWVVGCLGLAIGLGYYEISFVGTVASFVVLSLFKFIEEKLKWSKNEHKIYIGYLNKEQVMEAIQKYCITKDITVLNLEFYMDSDKENREACLITMRKSKATDINDIILKCGLISGITSIYEVKE